MISLFFAFILSFSCSKDGDLLADYPTSGSDGHVGLNIIVVNDAYSIPGSGSVVLDVLQNDNIGANEDVVITGTTDPANGSVVVNNDNTISYTPEENSATEDSFTYTVEVVNSDGTTTSETGNVTVSLTPQEIPREVSYWKDKFDKELLESDGKVDLTEMLNQSTSGNKFQEYYYMYYYFDGFLTMWQATGDNSYLDTMLKVVKNTMKDAKPVTFNSAYLGWKADASYGTDYSQNGVALWESYFYKAVATMLRIMYKSPRLLASPYEGGTYQDAFKQILSFTETNIWNKWMAKGSSYIYRSRTHMASHWARIGMELFIITGNKKYKDVFDNISHGTMPGVPSNLRGRLYINPEMSDAYIWDSKWEVSKGGNVQDTSHASDIISFWVLAYQNGMYWDKNDIDHLVNTLDKVVFTASDGPKPRAKVDGSGGYDTYGRLFGWLKLGRYNRSLQDRLISQYHNNVNNTNRYAIHNIGNFALNEKILQDGAPVYPEN